MTGRNTKKDVMPDGPAPKRGGAPRWSWLGVAAACLLILLGGATSRTVAQMLDAEMHATIRLPNPLRNLPMQIGEWAGTDIEIPESTLRIAQNDDYVCRTYRNQRNGETVALYIGYTARPRTMLGHRPTVCYPRAGWSHLGSHPGTSQCPIGPLPYLFHRFMKPGLVEERKAVLNYYVLNGKLTIDEDSFWSFWWRDPNLARDALRYVAQVQVIVPTAADPERAEEVAARFASEALDDILELLPTEVAVKSEETQTSAP